MAPTKEDGQPLKIDFYGGSISAGYDFLDHKNRRFSALVEKALGVETFNLAIPAAGVSQHLLCGIDPADIISFLSIELMSSALPTLTRGTNFSLSVPNMSSFLIYGPGLHLHLQNGIKLLRHITVFRIRANLV